MVKPVYPSFTNEWRNDSYPEINPSRPELSLKGKKVVITGGGIGIGRGLTKAFAQAGAASIAILGRRAGLLNETRNVVGSEHPDVVVTIHVSDISKIEDVRKAAKKIGHWDILVSNAGYIPNPATVQDTEGDDWWRAFQVLKLTVQAH